MNSLRSEEKQKSHFHRATPISVHDGHHAASGPSTFHRAADNNDTTPAPSATAFPHAHGRSLSLPTLVSNGGHGRGGDAGGGHLLPPPVSSARAPFSPVEKISHPVRFNRTPSAPCCRRRSSLLRPHGLRVSRDFAPRR